MIHKLLQIDVDIVNDEYIIKKPLPSKLVAAFDNTKNDLTLYCNNLDIFYIYIIKELINNGYLQGKKGNKKFDFVYKKGVVPNVKIINKNGAKINFVNFNKKFGITWEELKQEQRIELVQYAVEKGRIALSLGADAYTEFVATVLHPNKYRSPLLRSLIMRRDNHYPIFYYDKWLLDAKDNVSGYQYCIPGTYNNIYDIDKSASYPSQLLCNTPCGLPVIFRNMEDVPPTYFKVITFTFFNCELKPDGIDFIKTESMGVLTLTQSMFDLFLENYSCDIKIRRIMAFKTQKSPFYKFINQTLIEGKTNEKRPHIAKYNKNIGNSLVGYFGRNIFTANATIAIDKNQLILQQIPTEIDPIYLPVYLFVLDRAKAEFIKTAKEYKAQIIYANTDGFLCNKPLPLNLLNINNTNAAIGNYRIKHVYKNIYIECMNGYTGITTDGQIDNTISGITLAEAITPEQYRSKNYTYYINEQTPYGTIRRLTVKPFENSKH